MKKIALLLLISNILFGQATVPIINSSRTVNWDSVGLYNTFTVADHYINVMDLGAHGTGLVDDYSAVSAAIDSAKTLSGLTIIYFPEGTYLIESQILLEVEEQGGNVTFDGNIIFQGDGESTILEFDLPDGVYSAFY